MEHKDLESVKNNNKQITLFAIVIFLLILLLLLGIGFFIYTKYSLKNLEQSVEQVEEQKTEIIDIYDNSVASTRLINIMSVLNNNYLESKNDVIGYIFDKEYNDVKTISNDYIIYTAINYLVNYGELEDNDDSKYTKKISNELVDKTIKNIFGDVKYTNIGYLGNSSLCPYGIYDKTSNYYLIDPNCTKSEIKIETYNIKVIETPSKIDVLQAISYVKTEDGVRKNYKDKELKNLISEENNYRININNYSNFKQYRFSFKKGSDNLYHFDSISEITE